MTDYTNIEKEAKPIRIIYKCNTCEDPIPTIKYEEIE